MVNLGGLQSVRFGEKGTFRLTFTVWTVSANGAYRHVSRGANIVASQLVVRLLEIKDMVPELPPDIMKYLQTKEVRDVADEIMGAGAADIVLQPTANIGVFNGGAKVNRIPKKAVFEADIRLPIGIKADVVLGNTKNILKDFPEASFEVQQAASNPANFGDRSSFSQHFTSSCSRYHRQEASHACRKWWHRLQILEVSWCTCIRLWSLTRRYGQVERGRFG
jgi:acetylornithine deacetylase/succinyl-diaminopimelate desuccinylase-like protein